MPPRLRDSLIRFPTMTALSCIPQQHVPVFRPRLVEPNYVEISDAFHDDAVRLRVVHWCLGAGECGGGPEPGVWGAEVGYGV